MADTRIETERHVEEIVELSNEEMEQVRGGSRINALGISVPFDLRHSDEDVALALMGMNTMDG